MSKNADKKCFSVNIQTFTHIFHVCNTCTVLFTYLTLSYLASSKCLLTLVDLEKQCDVIITGTSSQISQRFVLPLSIFKMANPFVGRHQVSVPPK